MKVELERDNLFFASFCSCFVVMQVSTRMAVAFGSETSISTCLLRVTDLCGRSTSGVYAVFLACIIVTFHTDCHYFLIWILSENYFHTSKNNIFQCMNSTTILLLQAYKYVYIPLL